MAGAHHIHENLLPNDIAHTAPLFHDGAETLGFQLFVAGFEAVQQVAKQFRS